MWCCIFQQILKFVEKISKWTSSIYTDHTKAESVFQILNFTWNSFEWWIYYAISQELYHRFWRFLSQLPLNKLALDLLDRFMLFCILFSSPKWPQVDWWMLNIHWRSNFHVNPLNKRLLCYCAVSETRLFYDVIVISCNQTRRSPGLVSEWSPWITEISGPRHKRVNSHSQGY